MEDTGVHLLTCATGDERAFFEELSAAKLPGRRIAPGLAAVEGLLGQTRIATARQCLPRCRPITGESVSKWSRTLAAEVIRTLPEDANWQLHLFPLEMEASHAPVGARAVHSARRSGSPPISARHSSSSAPRGFLGGTRRCELVHSETLAELRECSRLRLRMITEHGAFTPNTHLIQLLLIDPNSGWLSYSPAPEPFALRHLIVPFPGGQLPVAVDKNAPSRAFAKLVETELRFGRRIRPGEVCVDLGASPGGWTWVARQRGARVIAVDRSPLRDDLQNDSAVTFVRGDAFGYEPARPVDWLVCDVIAAPERSVELVLEWARRRWMRHFVVTIKLRVAIIRSSIA